MQIIHMVVCKGHYHFLLHNILKIFWFLTDRSGTRALRSHTKIWEFSWTSS